MLYWKNMSTFFIFCITLLFSVKILEKCWIDYFNLKPSLMTVAPNITFGGLSVCSRGPYNTVVLADCSMATRISLQGNWLRIQGCHFCFTFLTEYLFLFHKCSRLICLFIFHVVGWLIKLFLHPPICLPKDLFWWH